MLIADNDVSVKGQCSLAVSAHQLNVNSSRGSAQCNYSSRYSPQVKRTQH